MNTCKECRFWKEHGHYADVGECDKLAYSVAKCRLERWTGNALNRVRVSGDFCCAYFEEKQAGPFCVVCCSGAGSPMAYQLQHSDSPGYAPVNIFQKSVALKWRDWLNDLWAERESEQQKQDAIKKSCKNCDHYPASLFICGAREFVCDRWERKEGKYE